jgi:hypothetical protein
MMTTEKHPQFTFSDGWLLYSIALVEKPEGCSLSQILGAGDMVNHAIFTGPELRRGFAKLIHEGYVQERDGLFFLSGDAKTFWESQPRKTIGKMLQPFESFLGTAPLPHADPREDDPDWSYSALTDDVLKEAYQRYSGEK